MNINLIFKFSLIALLAISFVESKDVRFVPKKGLANWSVLTYIEADNNLDQFAYFNVNAMQNGVRATDQVNVLVQWDKPEDNKTWRYKITPGGKIEDESLSSEMGYNPSVELVGAMQWVANKYPAQYYALVLWNHGSGIQDFSVGSRHTFRPSWIQNIGIKTSTLAERGVLYDDSQNTCLTNQGLVDALSEIKSILGKNLDILGMDACLMAMFEVCYEIMDYVNYYVASQELVPGEGWAYKDPLKDLTTMPHMTPKEFAASIVNSYARFYQGKSSASTFTLSALDLSLVKNLDNALSRILIALAESKKSSSSLTRKSIKMARAACLQMEDFPEYIDLGCLFSELLKRFGDKNKGEIGSVQKRTSFNRNARSVRSALQDGLSAIKSLVMNNVTGLRRKKAQGVSIYYPRQGSIDSSYKKTSFAQNSSWLTFLNEYVS